MTTLILADHDNSALKAATLNTVGAARSIGGDIHILVAGYGAASVAASAAHIAGVSKVLHAEGEHFAMATAENVAATLLAVMPRGTYSHSLPPATAYGKVVLPRVAAALDVAQISEI